MEAQAYSRAGTIYISGTDGDEDDCWRWVGEIDSYGYGRMRVGGKYRKAHRVVYEELVGPIATGLTLDHLCRNRRCVRPDHLEPVTRKENILRGSNFTAINARKTHCPKGHEYIPANTLITASGARRCRACKAAADRARGH